MSSVPLFRSEPAPHRAKPGETFQNESSTEPRGRWLMGLACSLCLHLALLALTVFLMIFAQGHRLPLLPKKYQAVAANGPAAPVSLQLIHVQAESIVPQETSTLAVPVKKTTSEPHLPRPLTRPEAQAAGDAPAFSRAVTGSRNFPAPDYPESARNRGETGTVILRLTFAESGRVARTEVMVSSGYRVLDENASRFILAHWSDAAQSGQVITVPVAYLLTGGER